MSNPTPPPAPEPEPGAPVPPGSGDTAPASNAPADAQPVAPTPAPEVPAAASEPAAAAPPAAPEAPAAASEPVAPAYAPPAGAYAAPPVGAAVPPTGAPVPSAATPGAAAVPPYGYAPPAGYAAQPTGDSRPKTLAIVALALAAVGLVLAFIPFVTWFSGAVLLAGFIVGLVALISKKHGGKGFSIAAVAVSVVGWIVSIVMSIASFGILGQAALEEAARDNTGTSDTDSESGAGTDEEPVAGDQQELVIVESAFGRTTYDDTSWWYVVVIDNPNEDYVFDFAAFDVEALDSAGTILDSSSDYQTVLSGRTVISGVFTSVGDGEITEIAVRGPEASDAVHAPLDQTGTFTIEGLAAESDEYSTTVRGTLSGDFEADQEYVEIVVIARDAAGAVIGAESGYVERLPAGGSAQFEAMFFEPLPADAVIEAYAAL